MARIVVGVSGGIAAYKALELVRLATKAGHGVRVLMTEGATRFVGAASFEGIAGAPVLTSEFERDPLRGAFPGDPAPEHDPIGHLEVAANCDAYIVAPASANTLAKLANGIADSMLTTSFLACAAPRLVAPAMNDRMYADAATQANLETLRERGITLIDPDEGALASRGEHGKGRLPDPAHLLARIEAELPTGHRPWDGLKVLVTAGGTREPIDSVRYIGNRSSGRMGIALAAAAARKGADVTLIAANVSLPEPPGVHRIDVENGEELAKAAQTEFLKAHVLLMAAAPADFRASEIAAGKLTRDDSIDLHLEPTEDILASLTATKTDSQTVVAFAAEAGENIERAQEKLPRKKADLIVLNDISNPAIGFESQENAVTLIDSASADHVSQASKDTIADAILERVSSLREEGRESPRTGGYSKSRPN
ncbi:MAG TPA: bifunctional phosphopantothenoylcysteine decarboxylase/phosphopantothenate--cysteine ligase CoaBC [Solirubrobacterales bacterium]|jgi:phosphopantothenoylcysteine decarboxylase/phosphopantothenate--cysteine ligase|nr:bifunctional phosphopantothenoylcysteine decarboxylase/phosphopantothenate--cysteine ligase CoaBC [Solirubrobacterales bacterium]